MAYGAAVDRRPSPPGRAERIFATPGVLAHHVAGTRSFRVAGLMDDDNRVFEG